MPGYKGDAMHIREKLSGQSFHVQSEVARNLIASGLCEQVVEEKKPTSFADFLFGKKPNTRWAVAYLDSLEQQLSIVAKCSTCKQHMSWSGTAILKTSGEDRNKFFHCGVGEQIPSNVLKRYDQLLPKKEVKAQPANATEAILRLYSADGGRREKDETEYVTADPQQI
jgi:hypothetical protein